MTVAVGQIVVHGSGGGGPCRHPQRVGAKGGGTIIFSGRNVLTGKVQTVEVAPGDYTREVITYEDVLPN